MPKTFKAALANIGFNLKTLLAFELLYLVFGVLVVFPLTRLLFYVAIRLSGHAYITNNLLIDFLFAPQTMVIFLLIAVIVSVYVVIEMVFLAIVFEFGYHKEKIDVVNLLDVGLRKVGSTLRRHHVKIVFPAFLFVFVVEVMHVSAMAGTFDFPRMLVIESQTFITMQLAFYATVVLVLLLFIETVYSINIYTFEALSFKEAYIKTRVMLKQNRLKILAQFVVVNVVLNVAFYLLYALVLLLLAGIVFITRGQEQVLGFLLSMLYSTYLIMTLLATIVLIPINYALIATWYYRRKAELGYSRKNTFVPRERKKRLRPAVRYRLALVIATVVLGVNIVNAFTILGQNRPTAELFNRPNVVAHRGASLVAPENTLASIQAALDMDADGIEFDVWFTADGVPVLMHDATLSKTTGGADDRRVDAIDYETLQTLEVGSWFSEAFRGEPIPTLDEALALIDGSATAYIDLKSQGEAFNHAVVEAIETHDLVNDVKVMSFSLSQLESIKAMNEAIETVLLISTFIGDFDALTRNPAVDNVAVRVMLLRNNLEYISRAHQHGVNVYVWTIESYDDALFFTDRDVDGLIVKDPISAREAAYAKNTNPALIDWLRTLFEPR